MKMPIYIYNAVKEKRNNLIFCSKQEQNFDNQFNFWHLVMRYHVRLFFSLDYFLLQIFHT